MDVGFVLCNPYWFKCHLSESTHTHTEHHFMWVNCVYKCISAYNHVSVMSSTQPGVALLQPGVDITDQETSGETRGPETAVAGHPLNSHHNTGTGIIYTKSSPVPRPLPKERRGVGTRLSKKLMAGSRPFSKIRS